MYGYVETEPLNERQSSQLLLRRFGSIRSMHESRDRYHREADFHFALTTIDLLKNLTYAVPPALGGDDHAGIEIYSHAGGSHVERCLRMSSISAAKSASSTGTSPVSASRALADAMHSERVRRGAAGARITATGNLPSSTTTSAPARTRANNPAKSLMASASDT